MSPRDESGLKAPLRPVPEVVWHDLECGSEVVDLPLWVELADDAEGPVLELGCGTGRVGLHLARLEHPVLGIDRSPALVSTFNERASREGLEAQAMVVDVRELHLRRAFPLIIAPMQLLQAIGDVTERLGALRTIASHLQAQGRAGIAIVEEEDALAAVEAGPSALEDVVPDQREIHGWVFSSRPLSIRRAGRGLVIERLRQSVSPRGEAYEERHADHLDLFDADRLEEEGGLAGLAMIERRAIEPGYGISSTVVIVEKR